MKERKNNKMRRTGFALIELLDKSIGNITLLGSQEKVQWVQTDGALTIKTPQKMPNDIAIVFKISL